MRSSCARTSCATWRWARTTTARRSRAPNEIGLAVAATTFSIVVVFVPIAFMGGIAGQWFAPFALTIAASVLVSLFVSFSLDPMLSAYWPDPHVPMEQRSWISRLLGGFNQWFDRQADAYKGVIAWALDHRLAMVALAIAAFVGALALPAHGGCRRRLRARDRRLGVHAVARDAAGLQPRVHAPEGRRSRQDRPAAARGGLHLRHGGWPGRGGGPGHCLRQAAAESTNARDGSRRSWPRFGATWRRWLA